MKALFFGITLFAAVCAHGENRPVVHIYGFGEFRGVFYNASGDIVSRHLPAALRDTCRERVDFSFEAPVATTREASDRIVQRSGERLMTIGLGITGNVPVRGIRIETEAANCYQEVSGRLDPDPPTCVVREDLRSRPIRPLPDSVVAPVRVDNQEYPVGFGNGTSCGTFVCNSSFYQGLQRGHDQHFIHFENAAPAQQENYAKALAQVICRMVAARMRPTAFAAAGERPHRAGANVIVNPADAPGKKVIAPH